MIFPLRKIKSNVKGDTIVEVIIGIAVLGLVMAVAYVSTSHSLQVGTDAGNRNRALGFAQQQVELVKYAENQGTISSFPAAGKRFCIKPANNTLVPVADLAYCTVCTDPSGIVTDYNDGTVPCPPGSSKSIYQVYLTKDTNNVYSSIAQWSASNGQGYDNLVIYYKIPS